MKNPILNIVPNILRKTFQNKKRNKRYVSFVDSFEIKKEGEIINYVMNHFIWLLLRVNNSLHGRCNHPLKMVQLNKLVIIIVCVLFFKYSVVKLSLVCNTSIVVFFFFCTSLLLVILCIPIVFTLDAIGYYTQVIFIV